MDTFPSGLAADSQASPARTEAPIEIHSLSLTKRFLAASGEGAPRLECLEDKSICEIRCLARGTHFDSKRLRACANAFRQFCASGLHCRNASRNRHSMLDEGAAPVLKSSRRCSRLL